MRILALAAAFSALLFAPSSQSSADDPQDPSRVGTTRSASAVQATFPLPPAPGANAPGDFFLLDNSADAIYLSKTAYPSGDVLLNTLGEAFWADLAPSDTPGLLFSAVADASEIVRIREIDGEIVSRFATDQDIESIAFDPVSQTLWGINGQFEDNRLFLVDPATGHTTLLGDTAIPGFVTALVFDPQTRILFAVGHPGLFYSVNPSTAETTLLGDSGLQALFGLAWNPGDDQIYGTDAETDSLYTISRSSGTATLVGGPYSLALFATGLCFGGHPVPVELQSFSVK